ncbi:MAG TPA: DNA-binding protein [Phycisphaerales bacterium]|nr:DNA-binding protein [Phycisphaerales bacterium]
MAEKLLTIDTIAKRLGVSRRTFYRLRARLMARGLQEVCVGKLRRYREASLDRVIQRLAETGGSI